MRTKLFLTFWAFALSSCASTQNPQGISDSRCEQEASLASRAAIIKWALDAKTANDGEKSIEAWRMICFILSDDFDKLGYSLEQSHKFCQDIYATTFVDKQDYDALSHQYYAENACKIRKEGLEPLGLKESIPGFQKCWDKEQKLKSDVCFEKVVKKEIYYQVSENPDVPDSTEESSDSIESKPADTSSDSE